MRGCKPPKARQKLWKNWDKSITYARKAGWEIVTARIVDSSPIPEDET